ncbi:hypothetical protein BU17DRAFT_80331 [Hysterangium stoloniferum]|nr:hypothetical protein BU17DRAFT_80331 [Hysterangium stoloniferum]
MSFRPSSSADAHLAAFATALQGISPGLAALHTSRLRLRNPDIDFSLSPNACIRCGHQSVSVRSRVRRNAPSQKNKAEADPPQRVIERTCTACRFIHIVPISRGNAALFPASRKNKSGPAEPNFPLVPLLAQIPPSLPPPPPPPSTPHTRRSGALPDVLISKRNKKKSGLQELLARNRQKQEQENKKLDASRGKPGTLSSFLDGL